MRVTLVIGRLTAGGAERVLTLMANYWAERGDAVTLITCDAELGNDFYPLCGKVRRRSSLTSQKGRDPIRRLLGVARRSLRLRREILASEPDVVISFIDNTNVRVLLAMRGSGVPVIVSERNDPHHDRMGRKGWDDLRAKAYGNAAKVTAQTDHALAYFEEGIRKAGAVVPNPVFLPIEFDGPNEDAIRNAKRIVAMGRLSPQKGFDMLIEAFAKVAGRYPDWSLDIWGDGDERDLLQAQIDRLGLEDRICLAGKTKEPFTKMRESGLFVLSSRFEGFPNVLCEAMACGLPVVSFACDSGPGDIIRPDLDGVLVPAEDVQRLADAMDRLMSDPDLRLRLASRAPEILERYSIDRVMGIWDALICEVLRGRGRGVEAATASGGRNQACVD